jgi:hypothetical protein
MSRIAEIVRRFDGAVLVDLENGLGESDKANGYYRRSRRAWQQQYPLGTNPARVLNDIRAFYGGKTASWIGRNFRFGQELENPSSPESIAKSLEKAEKDHAAWLKSYRDRTSILPDGTTIGGWIKETIAGDVFWRKGRRYVVDVVVEIGAKKTDKVLAENKP